MSDVLKPSFAAGELAPAFYGRIDIDEYDSGAATIKNMIVHPSGGVSNRGGTKYIDDSYSASYTSRLIPFTFSVTQAYMLEFSHQKMRVLKDGGVVQSGGGDYELTTPYDADELAGLDYAQSADTLYLVHTDYAPRKITRTAHDSWTIATVSFNDGPWASPQAGDEDITITPSARTGDNVTLTATGGSPFSSDMVGTPFRLGYADPLVKHNTLWSYGDVDDYTSASQIRCDVVNDFGAEYILNGDFTSEQHWLLDYEAGPDGDLFIDDPTNTLRINDDGAVDTIGRITQKVFIDTAADLILTVRAKGNALVAGNNGRIKCKIGTSQGGAELYDPEYVEITNAYADYEFRVQSHPIVGHDGDGSATSYSGLAYVSILAEVTTTTNANPIIISSVSLVREILGTPLWRRPAWTSAKGYPTAVCFHQQRLIFGGSSEEPQTIWASQSGDFEDMAFRTPYMPDDAFSATIAAQQVNPIRWMMSLGNLVIGTGGNVWEVFSQGAALTPSDKAAEVALRVGSSALKPIVLDDVILVAERGGRHVRAVKVTRTGSSKSSYAHVNVSIRAQHLLEGHSITDWAYARDPDSIVWVVRDDGVLLGLTYLPEYNVLAWHQHPMQQTDGEDPVVESVGVVEGLDADNDDVYLVVKRKIDGSWARYIEMLQPRVNDEDTYDYFLVDCGLRYSGAAASTISGLDHLEGEEVVAVGNGRIYTGLTVDSGDITLPDEVTLATVGLAYNADLETLTPEMSDNRGVTLGRQRVIKGATLRVHKSRGCKIGTDTDDLIVKSFREIEGASIEAPGALVSRDIEVLVEGDFDTQGKLYLRCPYPVPFTILAINLDVDYEE